MGTGQSSIISVLSKSYKRELTINQLSKAIKKSYAFTNQHAHSLIKEGILTKKEVGSAILCLLNLKNEDTIAHLVFNSMGAKKKYLEGLNEQKKATLLELITNLGDRCAFLEDSKITIISDEKRLEKLPGYTVNRITKAEFERKAKYIDFERLVILNNHESFWRMISKTAE